MTQAPPVVAVPPHPARPGPSLWVSISLMVAGVLIAIVAIVAITIPLVRTFDSRIYNVPSQFSVDLRDARYTIFEYTGSGFSFGNSSGRVTIVPSQVTVTAPDGEPVPVFRARNDETMSRGSGEYTSVVQFDAPMSGDYDVRVSTRVPTSVIVTRSVEDVVRSVLVWFGVGAVGGIIVIAGLVMLIIGVTRRSRARRAAQIGWGQPAWGQAGWGQPGWGQPGWGTPQYPPAQYPPPQYPAPQYPPPQYMPPQYMPPQYPPPQASPPQDPADAPPDPPADPPADPWAR